MHRACVKIDFEMMIIHILCQAPYFFIFDKKSFEMMFGDIHEHNIKQTSLGHRDIVFLLSLYFFFFFLPRQPLSWYLLKAEVSRARSARSGVPWITKSGYLCIQEILVLTKSSVRLMYRTYIHYTSTPLTWITEKELDREIKKTTRPISFEEKGENSIALLQNRRNTVAATKVKMSDSGVKKWTGTHATFTL